MTARKNSRHFDESIIAVFVARFFVRNAVAKWCRAKLSTVLVSLSNYAKQLVLLLSVMNNMHRFFLIR